MLKKLLNRQQVEKEIGTGAIATVQKCSQIKDEKIIVAVKAVSLRNSKQKASELLKDLKTEIEILKKLDSPQVYKFLDFHVTPDYIQIVTELLEGDELLDEILKDGQLPEKTARVLFKQVCLGINHCHNSGVMHRDIKAENIVFKDKKNSECKLIDFGLSFNGLSGVSGIVGTPFYMAPELFTQKTQTKMYDVWSLGILFQVMLCGQPPFGGDANREIIKNVQVGKLSFEHDEFKQVSPESIQLIKDILVRDPTKRMPLEQILSNAIFTRPKEVKLSIDPEKSKKSLVKQVSEGVFYRCVKTLLFKMQKVETSFKVLFLDCNVSHTSELSQEEWENCLKTLKIEIPDLPGFFAKICNKNLKCEYSVFKASLQHLDDIDMHKACTMTYNVIDRDLSSTISLKEFVNFVELQKLNVSMDEIIELFNTYKNANDLIEQETYKQEFYKLFDLQ